MTRLSVVPESL